MDINRSIKPQARGKIKFNLPIIDKFCLSNGLNVLFVKKTNLPILQFSLISNAGSRMDPFEKKGLANLLAALLDEGAGGMDSFELSSQLEFIGSSLSVHLDPDSFAISMVCLTEHLDKSLNLFSKVVTAPHLNEEDFQREKKKILARILQLKNEAGYVASIVLEKLIFGLHNPYALPEIGLLKSVEKIEIRDVKLFYETSITPQNSTMVIVGNSSSELLAEKLEGYLSSWHSNPSPIIEINSPQREKTKVYFVHKSDAPQTELRLGHISGHRKAGDYFPKVLTNAILGGQFSSRININLRENKGYTYGAHSAFHYYKTLGYFEASASVKQENTLDSLLEFLKELKGIREYISQKELRFAKSAIIRKYPAQFETYGQIGTQLVNLIVNELPDNYFNNYIDNIRAVSLEQAYFAAKGNIFPDELTIVAVGDKNKIVPQLNALGFGQAIEVNYEGDQVL